MNSSKSVALITLLSTIFVGCSSSPDYEPPTAINIENIFRQHFNEAFIDGREVIVAYVEVPPNTTMPRHRHPGEEFHYYLEGEVEIAIDDHPNIIGTSGTVGHVPFQAMHTAITGDKGARVLVFRVHTEGKPVRYLEDDGEAPQ